MNIIVNRKKICLIKLIFIFLVQVKQMLKRQEQSSKITNEQIQRKLAENGIHKDDLSKDLLVISIFRGFFL
jgi:hypothetical protein